jgi:flavodoxin
MHHGNTKKVADAIAEVLEAQVVSPKDVDVNALADYDVIGFGSGIAYRKHYRTLLQFVGELPVLHKKAFIFSTRGTKSLYSYHQALRDQLLAKGFEINGEFSCRGFDTYGLLKFVGGIAKGHPNEQDLQHAKEFAKTLQTPHIK